MKKIIIIILLILTTSCHANTDLNIDDKKTYKVSLVAVGDNLIHQTIYQEAAIEESFDFKPIFSEIKPYIKSFNLAFINQETILGGKEIGLSSYPCFNSPHELGDAVVDAGFNLISLANNHTLDRGEIAIASSIGYWSHKDVVYSGSEIDENVNQVKYFTSNDIKFAFVAYTYGTNGINHPKGKMHLANLYDDAKATDDISKAREKSDIVIVSMHWGNEYELYPSSIQKEQAKFLSGLGVDIIIGHHPHVVQPVELINENGNNTFVIYSLGNFLSDQVGIDRLIGMAVSLEINKTVDDNIITIDIKNYHARLLYRYKDKNLFLIKQFININEDILDGYNDYYNDKKDLITTYFKGITVD